MNNRYPPPAYVAPAHMEYLNNIREQEGDQPPRLVARLSNHFRISRHTAKDIVLYWIRENHNRERQ
jgi:hypothetical protein